MYDVVIIGAGLAGLQVARLVARAGARVLLADRRTSVTENVRTTGIFVRRTFEDYSSLHPFLGPAIRTVGVHSPSGKFIELTAAADEFRVGHMKPMYEAMLQQAIAAGVHWRPGMTYSGVSYGANHSLAHFRDGERVKTRLLVGADGARSSVARDLALDENHMWIIGVEDLFPSASPGVPRFDCWIDPKIAPGYLAWVVDDGAERHVGVGGFPKRFEPLSALRAFKERLGIRDERLERRGGLIPVNGVLRRIGNTRGLLVGDAAGAVSPLTAGGLDACMRLSEHAADVIVNGGTYSGDAFRSRFASRILMRSIFDVATRSRALIEWGFAVGRTKIARPVIEHVFFGRGGSFPNGRQFLLPREREKVPRSGG